MAIGATETFQQIRLVNPGQIAVSQAVGQQMNRVMRLEELARIAPSRGPAPTGGTYIEAGVGRAIDLRA